MSRRRLFWLDGQKSTREWAYDRREWKRRCNGTYQRQPGEYEPPEKSVTLVTHDEARPLIRPLKDTDEMDRGSASWLAVRGTDFVPADTWHYPLEEPTEVLLELVPTPRNRFDRNAVAVELDGKKLGNLPAWYAAYAQWKIRQLNYHGYRAFTAGAYRSCYHYEIKEATPEAFVTILSFDGFDDRYRHLIATPAQFRELWEALPARVREQVVEDEFHLDDKPFREILKAARAFPHLTMPAWSDEVTVPYSLILMLSELRREHMLERRRQREQKTKALWDRDSARVADAASEGLTRQQIADTLGLPRTRVSKIIKDLGIAGTVAVNQPSRTPDGTKDEVVRRVLSGEPQSAIEANLGLGKGRAGKILREHQVDVGNVKKHGLSHFHLAQMRERLTRGTEALRLQGNDRTNAQVAEELGISRSTLKTLLADARFLESPRTYPRRLDLARQVREHSITASQATPSAERRAIADANYLDLVHPGWEIEPPTERTTVTRVRAQAGWEDVFADWVDAQE